MENFYQNVMGLKLVADQGSTKIHQISESGFIGLVDERRAMHNYSLVNNPFDLRSNSISIGADGRYRAFVAYDPEGYFLKFDKFYQHHQNSLLKNYLINK